MKRKGKKNLLSFILCMTLIVAMAFGTTGCNGGAENETPSGAEGTQSNGEQQSEATKLGEGKLQFALTVVDKEGNETLFDIHTDKETVGDALLELKLISGENGDYGLYVKTVNGITADYDKDGTYWAFYINGEYASTGVDSTKVTDGFSYAFKVE